MKNVFKFLMVFTILLVNCNDSDDQTDETQNVDGVIFNPLQANPAPLPRDCGDPTSPLIGESRNLRISTLYGISGTVTIISDCEIEITDFTYNGDGPNVSVYAAIDGDFRDGVNMSEPMQGQVFAGETLNLFLPEGTSFNEFNSISIWCYEFDQDFSSASFE